MRLRPEWVSDWPSNIIPAYATIFRCTDEGCTVKGFYLDGVMHIQEVVFDERNDEHQTLLHTSKAGDKTI